MNRLEVLSFGALANGKPILNRFTTRPRAGVCGSVARGEAGAESDIDVPVELDDSLPMGIFEYARMKPTSTNSLLASVTS
jgi:predicted nucleotidyltransferase